MLPSPEPAPDVVLKAEHIHKEHYYKVRCRENVCKIKVTNEEGNIYYIEVTPETDFWKENDKYFQNDFQKFSKIVNDALILETGDITFKVMKEDFEEIILKFIYTGLFGFELSCSIPRKKDRVDLLDNEIQDLTKSNEEKDKKINDLETRLKYVEDIIQMNLELRKYHDGPFVNFPGKETSLQWINCESTIADPTTSTTGLCKRVPLHWSTFTNTFNIKHCYSIDLLGNRDASGNRSLINEHCVIYSKNGGGGYDAEISDISCTDHGDARTDPQRFESKSSHGNHEDPYRCGKKTYDWIQFIDKWINKEPGHFEKGKN